MYGWEDEDLVYGFELYDFMGTHDWNDQTLDTYIGKLIDQLQ